MSQSPGPPAQSPPAAPGAATRFIGKGSEMRDLLRAFPWQATSLGPIASWPSSLKTVVGIMMNAVQPMVLWWGADLVQIYNDAFVPSFGKGKHPAALGQPAAACWTENWAIIGPQVDRVLKGNAAEWYQDDMVPILRDGRVEDSYWSYTFTPVFDEAGHIPGVLVVCAETTARVLAERRRDTLDFLSLCMTRCATLDDIAHHVQQAAARNPGDLQAIAAGPADAGGAPNQVSVAAAELHIDVDLVLHFSVSPNLPFDLPYRQFLEQFTTIASAACLRVQSDAAQAIARAERDRLLLDAPVGAAVIIGEDLVYYLVNSLYALVSGRAAADMVGKPFTQVFPELIGSLVHKSFQDVYRAGTPFVSEETLVPIHRNGGELEDRYFTYNLSPLRSVDGHVYGLMVIAVDITQQVRARSQIEHLNTELRASSRAKDEFLALLGHELRNPLAPIVTALELMKLRDSNTGREQAVIRRQVTHLMRLVDDLLDVSRITRGKVELRKATVDLREVVGKAIEMASHLVEQKKQYLTVDVPSVLWHGDPARLAQVVANLLTNAARYTPEHGKISVSVEELAEHIRLEVSDNGMGISPALLPHIFDAFVQGERKLDSSVGGLGIGLALVKNLVEMHDGQVQAGSAGPGQGSTFTITLPHQHLAPAKRAKEPAVAALPAFQARPDILVVDDNRDAADSLAELLGSLGHAVTTAYDPAQALQDAARQMPEIAILDIGLPGMSGYELAEQLRKLAQGRPPTFIALTGYGQEDDKARSRQAGFAGHLVKPIDLRELEELLRVTSAGGTRP